MKAQDFKMWMAQFNALTRQQRCQLLKVLSPPDDSGTAQALVNHRAAEVSACPHCFARHLQRWGKEAGVQRFRCCACHQTFNALTGTPMARLKHRDVWLSYTQALLDGASIRSAAQQVGVHRTTSFRWRHRFLCLPAAENDSELSGIVEADETYFLHSRKGVRQLSRPARRRGGSAKKRGLSAEQVPVLVMADRAGHHFDTVLDKTDKATLGCLLPQLLSPESVLCTDGAGVYRAVAQRYDIVHEVLNLSAGQRVRQQVFHLQHVNAYDSRLKQWLRRFNGVATRYLPNYLGWRRLLEGVHGVLTPETVLRHAIG